MKHLPNILSALRIISAFCLLLFLSVPLTCWSVVPIAIVTGVATFAAIQEGHFIRKGLFINLDS